MKDDSVYLRHILDAIEKIEQYMGNHTLEEFEEDSLLQDGIIRGLEVIGEASSHLSPEMREKMSNINWASVIAMRNKLIHEYFGVDLEIVWKTILDYLPILKKEIKRVMEDMK